MDSQSPERGALGGPAPPTSRVAVYFEAKIGDAVLTLPALRALGEIFTAPLTLICPKVAFDLCFREVSPRLIDTTAFHSGDLPSNRSGDYDALAARVGAVDLLINTLSFTIPSETFRALRQRLAPTTSVGFQNDYDSYDIAIPKGVCHSADQMFKLAHLFDPSARIETYAQPLPIPPKVQEKARAMRAALPSGLKVLVVHADTDWPEKRWPVTRFIDVLDRFLSRRRDFVAWIVGMGHEELNVGHQGERVVPHLGLPLDLAMGLVAEADLFLGIDSSMLHAADLARVPGVGLFGPTRSATWGFRFGPHIHIDRRNIADITVEDVLSAMEDLAEDRRDSRTTGVRFTFTRP
ncbi:glycosyltransferase family 9 protein [Mycobacterium sp. 4858]|uniref:glycosyltransferase family 9 protein n=1 Tax=Mycobacterium sp. 4858 TaxID=2057185 RepID=UPI0013048BA4|nr:glycosyltransferase family 9 protein [Mycobacterium sp. 4858]